MMARYRFEVAQSLFTVQGFATGILSFAAHSPKFVVKDFRGSLEFDAARLGAVAVEIAVPTDRLELVDQVKPSDRAEIEGRMRGDVLQVKSFPEVSYRSRSIRATVIAPGRIALQIDGELSLHGVTRPHPLRAEVHTLETAARLVGSTSVRLSEHRISPVTALAGTIRLKDDLAVSFDLIALQETP
jgi:polyisoprenoid-binding protein YceI